LGYPWRYKKRALTRRIKVREAYIKIIKRK